MASFEDEIAGLDRDLDESREVKQAAEEEEKRNRQSFLTEFRDLAQNVILPPMRRAAEVKSKAARIEVKDEPDYVALNLTVTRDRRGPDHYWISYNADWKRKRVTIEFRGKSLGAVRISEIAEYEVEQLINDLIKSARKSGGQQVQD